MSPVPVIEVDDSEFQLNRFLRAYWFLFLFISIFAGLSVILAILFPKSGSSPLHLLGIGLPLDLQEIAIAACVLISYLGAFAVLWAAFAQPRDKPIFYYFLGVESFKRLLLVIPLFVFVTALAFLVATSYPGIFLIIFSIIGFCLGIVVFSSFLVLITRTIRIRKIVFTTILYSLAVFLISLAILLTIDFRSMDPVWTPVVFFMYALGTAAVFYVIATLIFEMILPVFYRCM